MISSGSPHVLRAHTGVHRTCGEPDEIKKNTHPGNITALFGGQELFPDNLDRITDNILKGIDLVPVIGTVGFKTIVNGAHPEPFNSTPMAVRSISPARLHVRPMGVHRTCG